MKFLTLLLSCIILSFALQAQTGTTNGNYNFASISTTSNSHSTGFKTQQDKLAVNNGASTYPLATPYSGYQNSMYDAANNTPNSTGSITIKAEGGSVCKTFTLKNINFYIFNSNNQSRSLKTMTVTIKNNSGTTIATHTFSGTYNTTNAQTLFSLTNIPFSLPFPSTGYTDVSEINFTYTCGNGASVYSPSNLFFRSIDLEDISASLSPTITTTGTLNAFSTCAGTASAAQSFTVGGSDLSNDVTVTAPTGYEVSTASGSGYGSSVTLTQSGGTVASTTIYTRLASTATGTPSGNITVSSTGATTQNIAVSGTVNPLPTITLGSVVNIQTTSTSFSLPYTATTGSPVSYGINTTTPNTMSGFTSVSSSALVSSPISVAIPASAAGTYNFNLRVVNVASCFSNFVPFTVTVVAPASPSISVNGALSSFTTCSSIVSAAQNFTVSGNNLTNNIVVSAPTGYEVSTASASGYGSSVTLTQTGGSVSTTTIYARLTSTATGTPSGNITVASAGATTQNIAVSGTVNALPSITLGTVNNVLTTATSFSLPYTATTGSPNVFAVVPGSPNALSGFSVFSGSLSTSPLIVTMPASAAGTYNFNIRVGNSACLGSFVPFTVTVVTPASPSNSVNGTLSSFTTCSGTASAAQSFTVGGNNLTNNIVVTAPTGYEVSLSSGNGYASSVTLTQSGGSVSTTTIYARLTSTATGSPSGNITVASTGATAQNIAVSGTVNALPSITLGTVSNVLTTATSFSLPYTATTGSPNVFAVVPGSPNALSGFSVFSGSLSTSPLIVTMPASAAGTYNFNIRVGNSACLGSFVPFTVTVIAPASPSISVNSTLSSFTTCSGTASAAQSFTVGGNNLTNNIVVTAPTGYEVSLSSGNGYASSVTLTQSGGSVSTTTIYARLTSTATGTPSGNITVASTGATTQNIAVSGTVNALPTASISGTTAVCQNAIAPSITFTGASGTAPYTFTYTINGGTAQTVTTTSGNSVSVTVPTNTAGSFVYSLVSVKDGSSTTCSNAATGTATVTVNALPTASISGTTAVCQNATAPSITFTGASGTAPYTFTYTINGGTAQTVTTTSGNSVSVIVPTNTAGSFVYSLLSVKDGSATTCSNAATGTATVTVNPLPTASISAISTVICGAGNTTNLIATGGATYQWSRNGIAISGATASTYAAANIGTYTATATSAFGCTAPASGSLVVTQLFAPKANFSYDSYCTNKAINFTNTSTVNTTGGVSYIWSDNNANTSSATNARFTYPNAGNYSVKLKVQSNTCSNLADSVTVVVPVEAPRAAIRQSTLDVAINDNVQLQARNFGNQYAWSPSVGLSDPFISNPIINTSKEQEYLITIGVPSGCTTVDTLKVRIHESNKIYVPNVFTPNGDGQNDKLYLIPVGISELKSYRIFNRWGKKLFETSSISQGWDGTFNGQLQPLDTYVWTVLAVDKNGNTIHQEGTVTLLR